MPHLRRFLVAVDFSDSSLAAAELAVQLGGSVGARVDFLHVWRPLGDTPPPEDILAAFASSPQGAQMRSLLERISQTADVDARGRVVPSSRDVPDVILEIASSEGYDLLVIGMHLHEGLSAILKDGVAATVTRRAACPVIMVPAAAIEAMFQRPSEEIRADPRAWVS
ncbi:MAG: universal stress protein [Polyangiaceae bacterium]